MMMRGGPRPPKDLVRRPTCRSTGGDARLPAPVLAADAAGVSGAGSQLRAEPVFPAVIQRVVDLVLVAHDMQLLDQITPILLIVFS
ncbi:MAG: hypothetical protein U0521_29855 [Anaerolineae bacterium]